MKIAITGGDSGGHFYPLISVADKIREISEKENILQPDIIYFAQKEYNRDILFQNNIKFEKIHAGKIGRKINLKTLVECFKMFWGVLDTFVRMLQIYPNVVFTNGGSSAFPVVFAARILRIPVVIHASDTVPSRVLLYAGKFAKKISLGFAEASKFFPKDKVAFLGNPIRDEVKKKQSAGSHEFFGLSKNFPTILVLGGSQGSQIINDNLVEALPQFLEKYQVIHQVGDKNYDSVYGTSGVLLLDNTFKNRYRIFKYLNNLEMKKAAGIANLVIMRAGAGSINEVANWEIPSILIPLSKTISRDQQSNSFAYASSGAAVVISQKNLTPNILFFESKRIFEEGGLHQKMSVAAKKFFKPDAELKIANEIIKILLNQQK